MEKVPYGKYTRDLRLESVRLVTEGGLSAGEAAMRMSMPKSTLENWLRAFKAGRLEGIGKGHRPLSDVEVELARVKRELALVRMERDILKKAAAYFAKESLHGMRRWSRCGWNTVHLHSAIRFVRPYDRHYGRE